MHTPEQAAGLWCPMVRVARSEVIEDRQHGYASGAEIVGHKTHVVGGCNSASGTGSGPRNPASSRCIADQCAMWRWGPSDGTHLERRVVSGGLVASDHRYAEQDIHVPNAPTRGYCGLAGTPGGAA